MKGRERQKEGGRKSGKGRGRGREGGIQRVYYSRILQREGDYCEKG